MAIALVTGASTRTGTGAGPGAGRAGLVARARRPTRATPWPRPSGRISPCLAPDAVARHHRRRRRRRRRTDGPWWRRREALGGLDLLVNNASTLGATPAAEPRRLSPRRSCRGAARSTWWHPSPSCRRPSRCCAGRRDRRVLNITSDASVEAYEGWGGYGLSKAALDHMSAVLAVEEPAIRRVGRRSR